MSIWTHVVGSISLDAFLFNYEDETKTQAQIMSAFGENVPTGSEGPLRTEFVRSGECNFEPGTISMSTLTFGVVTIFGDLRAYESLDEIKEWIKSRIAILGNEGVSVRCMAVYMQVEGGEGCLLYDDGEVVLNKEAQNG